MARVVVVGAVAAVTRQHPAEGGERARLGLREKAVLVVEGLRAVADVLEEARHVDVAGHSSLLDRAVVEDVELAAGLEEGLVDRLLGKERQHAAALLIHGACLGRAARGGRLGEHVVGLAGPGDGGVEIVEDAKFFCERDLDGQLLGRESGHRAAVRAVGIAAHRHVRVRRLRAIRLSGAEDDSRRAGKRVVLVVLTHVLCRAALDRHEAF